MPQANRCQLSGLEVEGSSSSVCVGQTYLCVWGRSGSGHVNRISSFHGQSPPVIIDPRGYVECVFRVQRPAADSRISGQSHELSHMCIILFFSSSPWGRGSLFIELLSRHFVEVDWSSLTVGVWSGFSTTSVNVDRQTKDKMVDKHVWLEGQLLMSTNRDLVHSFNINVYISAHCGLLYLHELIFITLITFNQVQD